MTEIQNLKKQIAELQAELKRLNDGNRLNFSKLTKSKYRILNSALQENFRRVAYSIHCVSYSEYEQKYVYKSEKRKKDLSTEQIATSNEFLSEMLDLYLKYLDKILN